jgi:hypothetical protein
VYNVASKQKKMIITTMPCSRPGVHHEPGGENEIADNLKFHQSALPGKNESLVAGKIDLILMI